MWVGLGWFGMAGWSGRMGLCLRCCQCSRLRFYKIYRQSLRAQLMVCDAQ